MSPEKQRKYADFIDFYADLSEEEVIRYRDSYLSEKGEIMGLVSVLKEEGRQEGIQQGMQQGMQQEAQDMLIEVLTERFGSVSGELSEQIKRIDSRERLKDLLRQALRVKNFNEFGKKVVSSQKD